MNARKDQPFESLSESLATQLEELCAQFETAWDGDESPSLEEFLSRWTSSSGRSELLESLLLIEFRQRSAKGDLLERQEYEARFPGDREVVAAALGLIDGGKAPIHEGSTYSQLDAADETTSMPAKKSTRPAETPPKAIGRYRVESTLGQGGFGVVYRAYDVELDRRVAIKVPHATRLKTSEDGDAYIAEARLVANLDHPAIVPVYDAGRMEDGRCYVVSKLMDGASLEESLRERRFTQTQTVELVTTIADALHYAHLQGVVHRDVKPANILLDAKNNPYIADFGLALQDQDFGSGPELAGTPAYMSPEQARGKGHLVDGRSDIFSLGAVFYQMLTGKRPFRANSSDEMMRHIRSVDVRPPRQIDASIPLELERVCLKALAREATQRYNAAADMANELRSFLSASDSSFADQASRVRSLESRNQSRNYGYRTKVMWLGIAVVLMVAIGLWRRSLSKTDSSAPAQVATVVEPSLRVEHICNDGNRQVWSGSLGDSQLGPPAFDDAVRLEIRFTKPKYFFLIAYNSVGGPPQLHYPHGKQERPDARMALTFPKSDDDVLYLNDGPGQQVFCVVSSDEPLPSFTDWQAAHSKIQWNPIGESGYWAFDGADVKPIPTGIEKGETRGTVGRRKGSAAFRQLCGALMADSDAEVLAISFPVVPRAP